MVDVKGKKFIALQEVSDGCKIIAKKIKADNFKPDLIVAIAKGGLIGGYFLANVFGCPIVTINVQSYTGKKQGKLQMRADFSLHDYFRNILVFDDLCDSGKTMEYVVGDSISGKDLNVRTATLLKKKKSKFTPDYYYQEIGNERVDFEYEII